MANDDFYSDFSGTVAFPGFAAFPKEGIASSAQGDNEAHMLLLPLFDVRYVQGRRLNIRNSAVLGFRTRKSFHVLETRYAMDTA